MIEDVARKLAEGKELTADEKREYEAWFFANRSPVPQAPNVSDNYSDLGTFFAGEFISPAPSSEAMEVTSTGFSGSFHSGSPKTFDNGVVANMGTVKNGVPAVVMNTDGDLVSGNGSIVQNETGMDIGPGKLFLGVDGVLGDGGNIFLDTTNFDEVLSLTGSGGYSALSTGLPAGAVYCMVKLGTDIYIGGSFLQVGGVRSPFFAKWNGSAWSKPYVGELNGAVLAMAVVGTDIYLGGIFTRNYTSGAVTGVVGLAPSEIDGSVAPASSGSGTYELLNCIGKYNGTTVLGVGTGANNLVRALAVNGTTLYAGGDFTTMLGTSATRVCSIDTTGPTASALSTGLDGTCYSLIYSTDLYAGGAFTSKVRRYSGGAWAAWGTSGPNNTVYALAKTGNDLYAVGAFTSPASYIGKTTSGGAWGAVSTGLAGIGYAVAIDGTNIIAGFAGGENVQYYTGSAWTSLGTGVNSSVYALLVDTSWLIGGIYTTASGSTMYRISRYSASTAPTEMSLLDMAEILDGHGHYAPMGGYIFGTVAAGATRIASLFYTATVALGSESDIYIPLPAGTFYGLQVYMDSAQPGTGSLVLTVRKNGADTGLVLTIAAGAGAGVKSVVSSLAWADGDKFTLSILNNASSASGSLRGFTLMFKPSNL